MVSKAGAMKRDITWLGWPSQRGGGGGNGPAQQARAEIERRRLAEVVRDKQARLQVSMGARRRRHESPDRSLG